MSIIKALVLSVPLAGCGTAEKAPGAYEVTDTLAVLEAAVMHHFSGEKLDSAALDLEERTEDGVFVRGAMWRDLASRLEVPVARYSEVMHCEPGDPYERACHLLGVKQLIGVWLDEINEETAIVSVSAWIEPVSGRVFIQGAQYLLEQQQGTWSVKKHLKGFAS